jgi:type III secretory pathway component EscV
MTEQVFVDSLVAINITISLFLWCFVCLWTIRSGLIRLHRLQTLLLISTMFPAMVVISLSHASWSVGVKLTDC